MAHLKSVSPISGENTDALPVKDLEGAVEFFKVVLGFSEVSRDAKKAVLARDGVRIGLERKEDHEPGQAGSIAFAVDDLDALHDELKGAGGKPGKFGIDNWGGKQYRTFFMREERNGYCFCFHCPVSP